MESPFARGAFAALTLVGAAPRLQLAVLPLRRPRQLAQASMPLPRPPVPSAPARARSPFVLDPAVLEGLEQVEACLELAVAHMDDVKESLDLIILILTFLPAGVVGPLPAAASICVGKMVAGASRAKMVITLLSKLLSAQQLSKPLPSATASPPSAPSASVATQTSAPSASAATQTSAAASDAPSPPVKALSAPASVASETAILPSEPAILPPSPASASPPSAPPSPPCPPSAPASQPSPRATPPACARTALTSPTSAPAIPRSAPAPPAAFPPPPPMLALCGC